VVGLGSGRKFLMPKNISKTVNILPCIENANKKHLVKNSILTRNSIGIVIEYLPEKYISLIYVISP